MAPVTSFVLSLALVLIYLSGIDSFRFYPHFPKYYRTSQSSNNHTYRTFFFSQPVDHFGFANQDNFQERYLLADQYWNKNGGPIFFYTGNEGDITMFLENTGFMWDVAPEFGAMLVFAEHRYYGQSIPYGAAAFKFPIMRKTHTSCEIGQHMDCPMCRGCSEEFRVTFVYIGFPKGCLGHGQAAENPALECFSAW